MKGIKVLFLPIWGPEAPSSRLRVYQYLEPLKGEGIETEVLIPPGDRRPFRRLVYLLQAFSRAKRADVVFVQKQVLSFGIDLLARANPRIVFDFDDAIFTRPPWEKNPGPAVSARLAKTLRRSRAVITGNGYLAEYARPFCPRVEVISTGVDLDFISRVPRESRGADAAVRVGWTGTQENLWYLQKIAEVFPRLESRFGKQVEFRVISNARFEVPGASIQNIAWSLSEEYPRLADLDLGLAPLGDDPWSRGKCGFKAIQYMSLALPPVASRAGVYPEIIQDGVNGFLAGPLEEWEEKISRLAGDGNLRRKMGEAAREEVRKRFSLAANLPRFRDVLLQAARE
ncbi:MAG: glycosyltransferase family 4 protein [bacterium]|nr:glycosyltransferase family 4 protein [bacterium]